jgi:hypothetical protein
MFAINSCLHKLLAKEYNKYHLLQRNKETRLLHSVNRSRKHLEIGVLPVTRKLRYLESKIVFNNCLGVG